MKNSGASLIILWRDSVPSTHCKRRRWSTRLICAWPARPTRALRAAHTFLLSPRERCVKSWSIMPRRLSPKNAVAVISPEQTTEILDVHEALERLSTLDSRKAHVVELKYFGGLKHDEIAEVLKISTVTVRRDWVFAKAWLYTELHSGT